MALKYFLEHSLWHKASPATWRKSCCQQVKQSLISDDCQRFSPSSPAIPTFINNTKTWTTQALSCIELQKNIGSALLKKVWWQYHFYQFSQTSPALKTGEWRRMWFSAASSCEYISGHSFFTCADPPSPKLCPGTLLQSDFFKDQFDYRIGAAIPFWGTKMLISSCVSHPVSTAQFSIHVFNLLVKIMAMCSKQLS